MREGMPNPELLSDLKKVDSPEKEKGEPLHRVAAEAVWNWVAALQTRFEKKGSESWKSLSLSERLGTAAVPAIFLTVIQGCAPGLKELECTTDDQAYQDSIIKWAQDHPAEIQTEMDKLWGDDAKVTGKQIVDTLAGADLRCGVPVKNFDAEMEKTVPGAVSYNVIDRIIVNVGTEDYQMSLQRFVQGEEAADWSQEFIKSTVALNSDEGSDVRSYDRALMDGAEILIHESGHLTLNTMHAPGTTEKVAEIAAQAEAQMDALSVKDDLTSTFSYNAYATILDNEEIQIAEIDRVYGWGKAGKRAAEVWGDSRESEMISD